MSMMNMNSFQSGKNRTKLPIKKSKDISQVYENLIPTNVNIKNN